MRSRRRAIVFTGSALLLAGALAAAGAIGVPTAQIGSAASAKATPAPARPGGPVLMGTLTKASGNMLKISLIPSHTTATVKLTSKTTYLVNGKTAKSRPTWKKGEQIGVMGTRAKNGVYTARSVMVGAPAADPGGSGGPPPGGMPPVSGTVASASSSTLVVKTATDKTTFKLTSGTRYTVDGKAVAARPAFKAGQQVHVMATRSGSTRVAQMVFVGAMPAPPAGGPPPGSSTSG